LKLLIHGLQLSRHGCVSRDGPIKFPPHQSPLLVKPNDSRHAHERVVDGLLRREDEIRNRLHVADAVHQKTIRREGIFGLPLIGPGQTANVNLDPV